MYHGVSWARTCSRTFCELSAAFTAAAGLGSWAGWGSEVPKDGSDPFPVLGAEPLQEPWGAAAALPAPAALVLGIRNEEFIAPGDSQEDPDGLSHPQRREQGMRAPLCRGSASAGV